MKINWKLTMLAGILSIGLAGCSENENNKDAAEENKAKEEQTAQVDEMQKKLEKQQVDEEKTVAVVNDEEIKGEAYNSLLSRTQLQYQQMGQDPTSGELAEKLKESTLDSLIGQTLLLQEANKKGYEATEEQIDEEIETLKARFEDEKQFEDAMETNGLSMEELRDEVADNIVYTAYMDNELQIEEVKDEDVKAYYDQFAEQTSGSEDADAQTPEYEEVKEQIKAELQRQKTDEVLAAKVEKLKENAEIKINI